MNISRVRESLHRRITTDFGIYERRPGDYQLIVPIQHEDGDMVDVYLQDSPKGDEYVRICDFGMAVMRLSYTFDITTPARQQIFDSILINNNISSDDGNLYLDAPIGLLYESILQFTGCVQKVCNMRYWNRENPRIAFYDDLEEYVTTELRQFSPTPDYVPISDYPIISVDWSLKYNSRELYVFGVRGNSKAKSVAISLLEFQKARLSFISLVVHEDMEELGKKESLYLTRNADTQYPVLDDFKERSVQDIYRFAGVP